MPAKRSAENPLLMNLPATKRRKPSCKPWPRPWNRGNCRSVTCLTATAAPRILLRYCHAQLDAVEQQIQQLDGGDLKPWTGQQ